MDVDKANRWLTLLANFGVVAGIIFLAIEVRQNQAILEEANQFNFLEMRATSLETYNDFRALIIQDEDVSRIWHEGLDGEQLSESDLRRFDDLCTSAVWLAVTQYERSPVLGEIIAEGQTTLQAQLLRSRPGYTRCWDENKKNVREYGLGDFVDSVESKAGIASK